MAARVPWYGPVRFQCLGLRVAQSDAQLAPWLWQAGEKSRLPFDSAHLFETGSAISAEARAPLVSLRQAEGTHTRGDRALPTRLDQLG